MDDLYHAPVEKERRRLQGFYTFFRVVLGPFLRPSFHGTPYTPKSGSYLLLANHNTDMDPLYLGLNFPRVMRFVASEHLFRKGFLSRALVWLVDPIPRKKGERGDAAMQLIEASLADGRCVALFPEGNRSFDGVSGYISPRTAQLAKDGKRALITYRFEGGYLHSPRWSAHKRCGRIRGGVVREYSREELNALSVAEIYQAIKTDLYTNAYEEQRQEPRRFAGKKLAEHMETVTYLCPRCKRFGTLTSKGDALSCDCGYHVTVDAYGFLHGDELLFDELAKWNAWQKRYLSENAAALRACVDEAVTADEGQRLYAAKEGKPLLGVGKLSMFGDRLRFDSENVSKSWPMESIHGIAVSHAMTLFIGTDEGYYEVQSDVVRSGLKYEALWRILSGREYQ